MRAAWRRAFLSERGLLRVSYFHNQYGRQIEPVPATEVPALLPQLSPSEQQSLESLLSNAGPPRCELAGIPRPGR
jgi:vitamin B12 transporter